MYYYIKAMYDAWCDGQELLDVKVRYKVFVKIASKQLYRSEEEIEAYLKQQSWFKYENLLL